MLGAMLGCHVYRHRAPRPSLEHNHDGHHCSSRTRDIQDSRNHRGTFYRWILTWVFDWRTGGEQQDGKVAVKVVPTQVPGENEVLVKVAAIGINPTDWKSE